MTTQEIVSKLWNLCNILLGAGITYHQYVTELTYILFLKMAKETDTEAQIPEKYRWDELRTKSGIALKKYYKELLTELGDNSTGRIREIYQGAISNIDNPKDLEKIITSIDALDWYSAKEEGLGNLYEGLLEKNANEKKSGAGQYFTPRPLIDVMTNLMKPQAGERCNDPACGTFGFMIAAHRYVSDRTDNFFELDAELAEFEKNAAFTGCELVHDTHRLALMNAMLHNIDAPILLGDTLSNMGKSMNGYDLVLTNPPFGTKKGGERAARDDFSYQTSNKQLNFLQHIYRSLKADGKARAAVVLPDNVLFADGDGEKIRRDLMEKCNLHTILRLPTGIFYAKGVKTNVLFFTRGEKDTGNTQEVWIYDLRNEMPSFGKTSPLKPTHFDEFIACYADGDLSKRKETYSPENPNGRWRKFTIEEILARDKTSLDITWMKAASDVDNYTLAELLEQIKEQSANISKAVAELETLIGEVEE
ncbi:MAG: N-6 DNA methylase [Selenomonas massiliensis]